jgi:iron-sulfur cluster assembly accessory protein
MEVTESTAITLTEKAAEKVRDILADQSETYAGLRIQVIGGGCSGYSYRMGFDKTWNEDKDQVLDFDGLKVFIDRASMLQVAGTEVDYVDGLDGAGFKFNNPNATGTCGCGESFST